MSSNRLNRSAKMLIVGALSLASIGTGVVVGVSGAGASGSTPGVTARTITIGATVPISGLAKGYAEVSASAAAVFNYVNKHGGINGRKIKYLRLDDCYNIAALGCALPPTLTPTLDQTRALVTQDNVFATVGSLGTAAQDSVLAYLNQNHVPDLFVNSGSSDWNQAKYPLLFGFQPSYQAESKIFAKWITSHMPNAVIGTLGQGDDFGANGLAGLLAGGLNILPSNQLVYNPANVVNPPALQAELVQRITTLKTNGATVVVLDAIPPVVNGILQIAHSLSYTPQWVISSVGSDPLGVNTSLEVGAITFNYLPATNDAKNVWNKWVRKVIANDPTRTTDFPNFYSGANAGILDANMLYGSSYAVAFCEALKSLGKNPTRAGIVKAMTTVKFATPSTTPLLYSAGNHQGLQGGGLATVVANSNPANPPQFANYLNSTTYTTGDYSNTAVVAHKTIVSPIPSWLK